MIAPPLSPNARIPLTSEQFENATYAWHEALGAKGVGPVPLPGGDYRADFTHPDSQLAGEAYSRDVEQSLHVPFNGTDPAGWKVFVELGRRNVVARVGSALGVLIGRRYKPFSAKVYYQEAPKAKFFGGSGF